MFVNLFHENFYCFKLIVVITLSVQKLVNGYHDDKQNRNKDRYCVTEACIETANSLFKSMDRSADPCTDFDRYVCGRFNDDAIIPDKKHMHDLTSTVMPEAVYQKARNLMQKRHPSNFSSDQKVFNLYDSCINDRGRERTGLKPAKHFLCMFGGWPVLEDPNCNQNHSSFKWYDYVEKMFKENLNIKIPLINFGVSINQNKPDEHILALDHPSFWPATRNMLLFSTSRFHKIYLKFMISVAMTMGATEERAGKDMKEVQEFEIQLANISTLSESKEKHLNYKIMNISDLPELPCGKGCHSENMTLTSWMDFIQSLFDSVGIANITIQENEPIMIFDTTYLRKLDQLLNSTPTRTLSNYMGWRFVLSIINHLNKGMRKTLDIIEVDQNPTWKQCLYNMGFNNQQNGWLHGAIGSMYARRYFGKEQKTPIREMVRYLKESFRNIIKQTKWMSSDTRTKALKKLDAMKEIIAYPEELSNQTIIDDFYRELHIPKRKVHFENVRSITRFSTRINFKSLREKIDFNSWTQHQIVTVPNAYYTPRRNKMLFPAAFLQGIYYNGERPQYLNFGGIGAMIGHEMTHGFDALGRVFDENGNVHDWWTDNEHQEFQEKSQCFVNQYGNFTVTQLAKMLERLLGFSYSAYAKVPNSFLLNINGTLTMDENIADNGGIKEAYYAYDKWIKDHGSEELKLPGFKGFSSKQMFWISFAQIYCSKWTDDGIFKLIASDVHTPGRYRTRGVVMNSHEFAHDFGCQIGTPMNPLSKCSVWTSPTSMNETISDKQNKKDNMKEQNVKAAMMTKQNITNPISNSLPTFIRSLMGPIG